MTVLEDYGVTSKYQSVSYKAPDGQPLPAPTPTPSVSSSGSKPTAKPKPGQGMNIDSGITPAQSQAQQESDILTQRQAQQSGDLAYATSAGMPGYVYWSVGGTNVSKSTVAKFAAQMGNQLNTKDKLYTKFTAYDAAKKMSVDQLDNLRDSLYKAGFYDDSFYSGKSPRTPQKGLKLQNDPDFTAAFNQAFEYAANTNQTLDDALNTDFGNRRLAEEQRRNAQERTPLVVTLTNDDDLSSIFRKASLDIIGRYASPAEVSQFVSAFHGTEVSAQQQQYAMTGSGLPGGTGGTIAAPANPSAAAEEQLRQAHPIETGVQRGEQGLTALMKLFGGG